MYKTLKTLTLTAALSWLPFYGTAQANESFTCVSFDTNKGDIVLVLDEKNAPISSQNFLKYVNDGFYDQTIFHRIIDGFMVQGGGLTIEFQEKETDAPIKNESNNGLKNIRGTIAMARTSAPDSATSQFFINTVNNPSLDYGARGKDSWGYTVFGKVVSGMEVIDSISKIQTGRLRQHRDVPAEVIMLEKAIAFTCVKRIVRQQ